MLRTSKDYAKYQRPTSSPAKAPLECCQLDDAARSPDLVGSHGGNIVRTADDSGLPSKCPTGSSGFLHYLV